VPCGTTLEVPCFGAVVVAQVTSYLLVDYPLNLACREKVFRSLLVRCYDLIRVMFVTDITQNTHLVLCHWLTIEKPLELIASNRTIPCTVLETQMADTVKSVASMGIGADTNRHSALCAGGRTGRGTRVRHRSGSGVVKVECLSLVPFKINESEGGGGGA
jgi:hypothetical protein